MVLNVAIPGIFVILGMENRKVGAWEQATANLVLAGIRPPQIVDGVTVFPAFAVGMHKERDFHRTVPLENRRVPPVDLGGVPQDVRDGAPNTWGMFSGSQYLVYRSAAPRVLILDYAGPLNGSFARLTFEGPRVTFERNEQRLVLDLSMVPPDRVGVLEFSWDEVSMSGSYRFHRDDTNALEVVASSTDQLRLRREATIAVRDLELGIDYCLGSPGIVLGAQVITHGDSGFLGSDKHVASVIEVDLPFELPLAEDTYSLVLESADVTFRHSLKWRDQQRFSTLDVTRLPRFSHLSITVPGFREDVVSHAGVPGIPRADRIERGIAPPGRYLRSYSIICGVVDRVFAATREEELVRPILSYTVAALDSGDVTRAFSTVPHEGSVAYGMPATPQPRFTKEQWDAYRNAVQMVRALPATPTVGKEFADGLLNVVHDFCYFARQHPEVFSTLHEELVRDLLLIVIKAAYLNAEAEAMNYDGKADFKVRSPASKYEFCIGELKHWDGPRSAEKLFEQILRKHVTGQEAALIALFLSQNEDNDSVESSVKEVLLRQPESTGSWESCSPPGSYEIARKATVMVRGREVPLYVFVAQVRHKRV